MGRFRFWLCKILLRDEFSQLEAEMEEEFRFHIEMKAASLEAEGIDSRKAREAALKCFGNREAHRREGLAGLLASRLKERRIHSLDWWGQDLREGFRHLLRHPGFVILAAGTLALGLATSTAVFTYVNAYQQPFPGADADGLFQLFQGTEEAPYGPLSYSDYLDLLEAWDGSVHVAAQGQSYSAASARHETLTEVVFLHSVTGDFFPVLKVDMALGRGLFPDDDRPGSPPAVVISHQYWTRRYGRDQDVLGKTLFLNNQPYSIVGVTGPGFVGSVSAVRPDVWLPFVEYRRVYWAGSNMETNREAGAFAPYLRLADGVSLAQVEDALDVFAQRLDLEAPLEERTRRFILEPARWIHPSVRQAEMPTTRIMLLAAACLLLMACANVANLFLSAGTKRYRELALRSAIGASRGRLVRQLLAESLLLSILAGGLALALAGPAANRLSSYFARPSVWGIYVPREISVDLRVLAFGLLAALLAGVLTGVLPALRASSHDLAPALKAGSRWESGGKARGRRRLMGTRDLLVSVQVGLTVVLLFTAGLVLRTLNSTQSIDAGFDTDQVLASYVSTSSMGTPVAEREAFFRDLVERFQAMPWVGGATLAEQAPLSPHPSAELRLQGSDVLETMTVARVVPGYFETMEMDLVQGRFFFPTDTADEAGVVVINETLAGRMAGGSDIVGQRLWWPGAEGAEDRGFEIVGIVGDARQTSLLDDPEPVAYFSFPQGYYAPGNAFLLKAMGDPAAVVSRMEEELHAVDPRLAIVNILPYRDVVDGFLYTQRMNAELFSLMAILGLILSAAGVFGVTSLAVARMRKEVGIRLAVGAGKAAIVRLVMSKVSVAVGLGLAAGMAVSLLGKRMLESLLWGISPTDPAALILGVSVLFLAIGVAVSFPLRKALSVDPVSTLHAE